MTEAPTTAYIVSHTHWDMEWYKTHRRFQIDLSGVVRDVLDALENDHDFRHFLFDGQSLVLEDYLEIHPEDEDIIARLLRLHTRASRRSSGMKREIRSSFGSTSCMVSRWTTF